MTESNFFARMDGNRLIIEAGDYRAEIITDDIESNWRNVSYDPEKRASGALDALASAINEFSDYVREMASRPNAEPLDVGAEVERYARRAVELHRARWESVGRCASPMITGPANFPTERNRRALDAERRRMDDIGAHDAAARQSVERRAFPHGDPDHEIRSDHPDAPRLLRERIERLESAQEFMKQANVIVRRAIAAGVKGPDSAGFDGYCAEMRALDAATGLSDEQLAELLAPDFAGRIGFPSYALYNNNANIRRLKKRLAKLESVRDRGDVEREFETSSGTVRLVEAADAARIRLIFPGKPDAETRAMLKRHGFRWAPSVGAWQRHMTDAGRRAANAALAGLGAKMD